MRVVCTRSDVIETTMLRRVVDIKKLAVEQAYAVGKEQLIRWLKACLSEREADRESFEMLLAQGDYEISTSETIQLMYALGHHHPAMLEAAMSGYRAVHDHLPEGLTIKMRYSYHERSNDVNWEPSIYLATID